MGTLRTVRRGNARRDGGTFTNAVNTGQFKICKVSNEPTLQGVPFDFSYSYTVNGTPVTGTATLKPGECSGLSGNIPVVDPNGQPIAITVSEAAKATVSVSDITVDNGTLVTKDLVKQAVVFNVNVGFTTVTFTNVRTPPNTQPCNAATVSGGQGITVTNHELGQNGGTFQFDYDTVIQPDEITIRYEGNIIFHDGPVGTNGNVTVFIPFGPGTSTQIEITVNGVEAGTVWSYLVHCPTNGS